MTNLGNRANNGAQRKNTLLGSSKNVNAEKSVPAVLVLNKEQKTELKEEKAEVQDAVIIPEETTQAVEMENTEAAAAPTMGTETAQSAQIEMKEVLSIEKIMEKAEKLYKYKAKYVEIQAKIKEVEEFEISHDSQNAQLTLVDASGRTIRTSNPMSIGKVIEDWKTLLYDNLSDREAKIRQLIAEA